MRNVSKILNLFILSYSSFEAFLIENNVISKLPINKINFQHLENINLNSDHIICNTLPNNANTFLIADHTKLIVSPH